MDTPSGSHQLADLLAGHYDLAHLDHVEKIHRINYCIVLMDAMMKQGDLEHTGDWDWRIHVVTVDGKELGTYEDAENDFDYYWADTMTLPYTVEPGDYIDSFARWQNLRVEQFHNDEGDAVDVEVAIDEISHIVIGEA